MDESMMIYNRMFGGQGADPQMQYLQELMRLNPGNENIQEMGVSGMYDILDPQTQLKNQLTGYQVAGAEKELNSIDDAFGRTMDLAAAYLQAGDVETAKLMLDTAREINAPQSTGYMGYPGMQLGAGYAATIAQPQSTQIATGINPIIDTIRKKYVDSANMAAETGDFNGYEYYSKIANLDDNSLLGFEKENPNFWSRIGAMKSTPFDWIFNREEAKRFQAGY